MGYQHIDSLYKNQAILAQAECYALEKIHGTSAHITFTVIQDEVTVSFFSGGEKHENFVKLFNAEDLVSRFRMTCYCDSKVTIYGEAYGGKCQGMSATYGTELRFVAFEVQVNDVWFNIPEAHAVAKDLGLEFVFYTRIKTDLISIDQQRDAESVQAVRNGIGPGRLREGVVLFPLKQQVDSRGNRLMAKHKRDEFRETASPRVVTEPSVEIVNAEKAAHEFVTEMRLSHVLDKIPGHDITQMGSVIIPAMIEDVVREGAGELLDGPPLRKAISRRTAILYKERIKAALV